MSIANTMGSTTSFNLNVMLFGFTDVNPYASEGIALADVTGVITVLAPDSTIWHQGVHSNPDIDPSVNLSNNVIAIPTDANGNAQVGTYTITYEIVVTGAVQPGTYSKVYSIEFCEGEPVLSITSNVDCLCGAVSAKDTTNYTTSAGTWTITSRSISLRNASSLAVPQITTVAGPSVTVSNNIYFGTWTASLVVGVQLVLPTHTCTNTLSIELPVLVQCDDICKMYCCIKSLNTRYVAAVKSGNVFMQNQYGADLNRVTQLLVLLDKAVECGKNTDVASILAEMQSILNCNEDCGCGDEPRLLVPLCGGAGIEYNFIAGTGITITNIAGNVTISLSATNAAILAAIYNTTVSAGTGITVTSSTSGSTPSTTNYQVSLSPGAVAAFAPIYSCKLDITFLGGVPQVALTNETIYSYANTLTTPNIVSTPSPGPFFRNYQNKFIVSGYTLGPLGHKPYIRVIDWLYENSFDQANLYSYGAPRVEVMEFDAATGTFVFSICNGGSRNQVPTSLGAPYLYHALNATFLRLTLELLIVE